VQARLVGAFDYKPFDVNSRLAETINAISGAALDVRSPQQVLSVVCAAIPDVGHTRRLGLLGLSLAADNLSNWAGGARRFARDEGQVSRAEFKLLEALEYFQIELPARGVALDLGAAPGGWTRVLRQRDQYVTAVDPGELDPRITQDRGVRHKRMTAESYLAEEPERFDLIVNDMRMDARDSARLMGRFAGRLHAGGQAIMTVKLAHSDRANVLNQTLATLRQAYVIAGARQLFHNRSEITVWLQPKPR
jgi:23S rRNA (cytidine2498-2'-O)-methyltransferase